MPYLKIKSAASYPNGIAIRSVIAPKFSVKVFQDLKGNIHHAVLYSNQTLLYSPFPFEDSYYQAARKVLYTLHTLIIILLLFFRLYGYATVALTFTLFLTKPLSNFMAELFVLNFVKDGKKNAKFHAVEHKMVNFYHKFRRVPTLSEIKKASRFTITCGSLDVLKPSLSFISLYLLLILSNELFQNFHVKLLAMFISALISLFLLGWGDYIFQYLEVFLTKKPTDTELLIGIEAIKSFLILEGILSGEISEAELEKSFDNVELIKEATNP